MAEELGKDESWKKAQIEEYEKVTSGYLLD
jgi:hypothetical protein